jgi:hypothetical protein
MMFVQWCIKGVRGRRTGEPSDVGLTPDEAIELVRDGHGIKCNWWRRVHTIATSEISQKLTSTNLDLHVNNYNSISNDTPFISLTAGCVERDVFYRTNRIVPAEDTALMFATDNGTVEGFLFYCWVIVGLKPAVSIGAVAEEVRELNSYRSWSGYQLEGELTAKIYVPSNQIEKIEWWAPGSDGHLTKQTGTPEWNPAYLNTTFNPPSDVSNIRELF